MEQNFETLMAAKSDEDLQLYITDSGRYKREAVDAAINELKNRGEIFSDEEIAKAYNAVKEKEELENKGELFFDKKVTAAYWKRNVVDDTSAPLFYSERVIWIFSTLFSVLAGSILLTINLYRYGKKRAALFTLLFGIIAVSLSIWMINFISLSQKNPSGLAYIFGALGGLVLTQFFWRKYIGANTQYRARSFWVPLIICVLISALVVILIIMGQQ